MTVFIIDVIIIPLVAIGNVKCAHLTFSVTAMQLAPVILCCYAVYVSAS